MTKKVWIGTSGWHYPHWKGSYYPKNLPAKKFFSEYTKDFNTVEVNRTFYKLPEKHVFAEYRNHSSSNFLFSIKASRYITHIKRLKEPKEPLGNLFSKIEELEENLGPILFQLPPNWKVNLERLESFLKALPKKGRYVFEFRDPRWWNEEVYKLLKKYKACFCIYDLEGKKAPTIATTNFLYIRLHGPHQAYQGSYSKSQLKQWAQFIQKACEQQLEVFCYFNNDQKGYAPNNAATLIQLLNG